MDYGLCVPTYIDMWREVVAAEEAGFTHAWFPDSQLIWSDTYAAMALAAERTSTIKLGTLVSIPSNRIAPVTASAIATINKLAPGRVILALGTGYTGRNTMGLPSYPVAKFREYSQQVKGLLAGEDVLFSDDVTGADRWIRLIHPNHEDFINITDPIPLYLAANGPRAMGVVGELGDGWVTAGGGPAVAAGFPIIEQGAASVGRAYEKPYTVSLDGACVLRDGETISSPRVVQRVGPWAVVAAHTLWEMSHGRWGSHLPASDADTAGRYHQYISEYAEARGRPTDRLYLDVHEGHYSHLKEGEEQFVDPDRVRHGYIGSGPEIIEKVEAAEAHGINHIALAAHSPAGARELIADFAREVIQPTSG